MMRKIVGVACVILAGAAMAPATADSSFSGRGSATSQPARESRGIWDIRIRRMALPFDTVTYRESFGSEEDRVPAARRLVEAFLADHRIDEIPEGGKTALMEAAAAGQDDVVRVLLERHANPNLVSTEDRNVRSILRYHDAGKTALMFAAEQGKFYSVEHLLAAGADVEVRDPTGLTALGLARRFGHDRVARILERHAAASTGR